MYNINSYENYTIYHTVIIGRAAEPSYDCRGLFHVQYVCFNQGHSQAGVTGDDPIPHLPEPRANGAWTFEFHPRHKVKPCYAPAPTMSPLAGANY